MRFNPLKWKAQHRVAAIGFMALGAIAGAAFGNYLAFRFLDPLHLSLPTSFYEHFYARLMVAWAILAATLVGLIIYFIQLFRD